MSVSVDTNVIVRLLVGDDAKQANKVRKLFESHDVLIVTTVILESEWVLRSAYGFDRQKITAAFARLFGLPQVSLGQPEMVHDALAGYREGMDFADALHMAGSAGADRFATFDQKLIRKSGKLKDIIRVMEP